MTEKRGMKALELWCRKVTEGYPGVKVENMTTSWRDGLAFCALIHHFRPDLIDFDRLDKRDIYKNNQLAFRIAERQLGIPALLDAEDMVEYEVPDRLSILTYLSQFYQTFVGNQQGASCPSPRSHTTKVPEIISSGSKSQKTPKVSAGRLESCWSCRRPVFLAERLVAGGKLRHRTCFTCQRCGHQLNLVGYYETENGDFVCETCPDEEKQSELKVQSEDGQLKSECEPKIEIDTRLKPENEPKIEEDGRDDIKDSYSLEFETALETVVQNRRDESKLKFLQDLVDGSTDASDLTMDLNKTEISEFELDSSAEVIPSEREGENVSVDTFCENQHSTAKVEKVNVKARSFTNRNLSGTLISDEGSDSFKAEVETIIDKIISDAVLKIQEEAGENLNNASNLVDEEKRNGEFFDSTGINEGEEDTSEKNCKLVNDEASTAEKYEILEVIDSEPKLPEEKDYPDILNPFSQDDSEPETKPVVKTDTPEKPPVPAARTKTLRPATFNQAGQKIIEAPVVNLNPFWSDGEPSSDEEVTKPVPAPRSTVRSTEQSSPFSRSQYGSFTSLNSVGSSASVLRKKKGPAPLPPSSDQSLQHTSSPNSSLRASSSSPLSARSHRKSKPAPPPPPLKSNDNEVMTEKTEKNYENKVKQNLLHHDKSSYGKWKRKKGQAPGLPIPQRRRITPLPLLDFYRELEDLEIQQRELERQGVTIEQTIRNYEAESVDEKGDSGGKDIEELILQLFEIVNQKNELFRRQAELMYLRRQQRLEEEHADIEYQIRCLMGRPERNKTDSDKAQEEELIRRLVEVVERRNEIIECLDMDRKREVEEDESIHHHLEAFAVKKELSEKKHKSIYKTSPTLLKYIKKKKGKKEKVKELSAKSTKDTEKDIDEGIKPEEPKTPKIKKKWFKP